MKETHSQCPFQHTAPPARANESECFCCAEPVITLAHSHTVEFAGVLYFHCGSSNRPGLVWPGLAWRAREMRKQPFYVFVASAHDSRQRRCCPGAAPAADAACSLLLQPYKFSQFTLLSRTFIAFNLLTSHLKLFFSPAVCTLLSPFLLNLLTRTHTHYKFQLLLSQLFCCCLRVACTTNCCRRLGQLSAANNLTARKLRRD